MGKAFGERQSRDRLAATEQPGEVSGDDPRAITVGRGVLAEPGRQWPTQADRQDPVRIEGVAAYLSQTLHEHKRGRVGTDRSV
jgi:hypothetical protein